MTFTRTRLSEARQRCEAATRHIFSEPLVNPAGWRYRELGNGATIAEYQAHHKADVDFDVNARTDLPDALDMLERAANVLDRLATGDYDDLCGCARCAARRWVEEYRG